MNDFPIQVVCEWIGNSQLVAQKHYLQVTDEHFKKAVQKSGAAHSGNGGKRVASGERRACKKP